MLLDEIESFVRVVEAGSFTAAAKQLGVPKSTLSRALSRLEDATQVRLLRRSTRSISLTEAGGRFFEEVSSHVGGLRHAMNTLSEEEDIPRGVLRVTMPVEVGESLLADVVTRFAQRYPKVIVEVDVSGRIVNLLEEGFDLAIRASAKLKDSTLIAKKLFPTEMMLFASPGYVAKRGAPRSIEELAVHDTVLFHPTGARTDLFELKRFAPNPRLIGTDFSFVRAVLAAGGGVGPLPSFCARSAVAEGKLVRVIPGWSKVAGALFVVYPHTRHVPKKVLAFRDFVVELLTETRVGPSAGASAGARAGAGAGAGR